MSSEQRPCVFPAENVNPSEDAATLRAAMKGFGTDEKAILYLLTSRSNAQRQQIKEAFEKEFERDLIDDLKSELGGNFEKVILALMKPSIEYLCAELHGAMNGMGTNENCIIEILCTRPSEEINEIATTYEALYDRPLVEHLCREISGKFSRLITLIVTGTRDPIGTVHPEKVREDAELLYAAGEEKLGTDEHVFNRIMSHSSFEQLALVFDEYKSLSGMTIEQSIKHEFSGNLHDALQAIVESTQSRPAYFAKRVFKSMDGMGTDDTTLIRIIVSRSEIDLENIKDEFERMFNRTLSSAVENETSGDYKKALIALLKV